MSSATHTRWAEGSRRESFLCESAVSEMMGQVDLKIATQSNSKFAERRDSDSDRQSNDGHHARISLRGHAQQSLGTHGTNTETQDRTHMT